MATRRNVLSRIALVCVALVGNASRAGDGHLDPATGDLDFSVSFRYPPTSQQLSDAKAAVDLMAFGLCDATEGQVRARRVTLQAGQATEDLGDFWLHADEFRSGVQSRPDGSNLGTLGAHVNLSRSSTREPDVWLHEFGHHGFGLGEQYEEQDRWQGCGIGVGFDAGVSDEQNHSIMQEASWPGTQCAGGGNAGARCLSNADCPASTCQLVLMSELSVTSNHDRLRGTGNTCPANIPLADVTFTGQLVVGAAIQTFDPTSFATADASSARKWEVGLVDSLSTNREEKVFFYAIHSGTQQWTIAAAVDGKTVKGTAGTLQSIEQWTLSFNADGSLASVSEASPSMMISNLTTGAPALTVQLHFGTPNPTAVAGQGQDGLVEGAGFPAASSIANKTLPGCPDVAQCVNNWNATTGKYESTDQSMGHGGESDWQTVVKNYPFLTMPAGLPQADAPAGCFRTIQYVENVSGSDQVLLLLDRSGSMAWSASPDTTEICGNSVDDDADGSIDEADCGAPRIQFVQDAANAYMDLQQDAGVDLGVMTFNGAPTLDRQIGPLAAGNIDEYRTIVAGIAPGGATGIGDALDASKTEFARVAQLGRSRTAYLMTDGYNTSGVAPDEAAARLRDIGVRVHVIPAGKDVKEVELSKVASTTGGTVVPAASTLDLPAVFAELAGRHQGAALAIPRTHFSLDASHAGRVSLFVEKDAEALVVFVSGRNPNIGAWKVGMELRGPNGERFQPGSPAIKQRGHYTYIHIAKPSAGPWSLILSTTTPMRQDTTAVAYINNAKPDFFADAHPRAVAAGRPTMISAVPVYVTDLDARDVSLKASVIAPDGSRSPLAMTRNRSGAWSAATAAYADIGLYDVELELTVGDHARLAPGESIYPGPPAPAVDVVPFHRIAKTSFAVVTGQPSCWSGNPRDCDADGIVDSDECPHAAADIDKDGRPNNRDPDADGDEIPDAVEGLRDTEHDGVADMCEPGPARFVVPAKTRWFDTGIVVKKNQPLRIGATGTWSNHGPAVVGPKGFANHPFAGTLLESANLASLVGKVGDHVFAIGERWKGRSPDEGTLLLSINDTPDTFGDNEGALSVSIRAE